MGIHMGYWQETTLYYTHKEETNWEYSYLLLNIVLEHSSINLFLQRLALYLFLQRLTLYLFLRRLTLYFFLQGLTLHHGKKQINNLPIWEMFVRDRNTWLWHENMRKSRKKKHATTNNSHSTRVLLYLVFLKYKVQ